MILKFTRTRNLIVLVGLLNFRMYPIASEFCQFDVFELRGSLTFATSWSASLPVLTCVILPRVLSSRCMLCGVLVNAVNAGIQSSR